MGSILLDTHVGKDFLNRIPLVQELKSTSENYDIIKLQSFYGAKGRIKKKNIQKVGWQQE